MLLYIHIPFCDSKCHYCAFNSYTHHTHLKRDYMKALQRQWESQKGRFGLDRGEKIETLFVGGGTPSTIDATLYGPLFEQIRPYLVEDAEITFEANPHSASASWLEGIRALGATRVSFGVQSFDPEKLHLLGRAHTPQQAHEALHLAHSIGFEHLSLDLIYGVRGDTIEKLGEDLDQALALPIDHLSLYALSIEEHTPFAQTPHYAHEDLDLIHYLFDRIRTHGFEHYEISNFGTYRSRHNLGYWEGKAYIGLGAGAVGYEGSERLYPPHDIATYIADPLAHTCESLTPFDRHRERLFLGLRSCVGIAHETLTEEQQKRAQILIEEGLIVVDHDRYYATNYLLADELTLYLEGF